MTRGIEDVHGKTWGHGVENDVAAVGGEIAGDERGAVVIEDVDELGWPH